MQKNKNIILLLLANLLQGLVFYAPVATLYRQAAGISVLQITVIESISLALCVVLELPWGIVADRIGYRNTMIICMVLEFISKIVFWKADGFGGFLLERILLSIVIAGLSGVDASILYLSCKKEESQKVFSVYYNLNTVGLLAAAGIYTVFLKENYRMAGFLTMVIYGIRAVIIFGIDEVKEKDGEEKKESGKEFVSVLKEILTQKRILLLVLGVALLNETHQTITVFLNQLQYLKCGMDNAQIGIVYGIVTIAGLLGFLSARMTKKWGRSRSGNMLFLGSILSCLILMITKSAILSILAIMLLRICFSLLQPLQESMQNDMIQTSNRATALSVNAVLMDAVAIFTNVLFGRAADINIAFAMGIGVVFCIVGFVLFRLGRKE